jgi:hypothetical protein
MMLLVIMIKPLSPDDAARPGLAAVHAVGPARFGEVLAGGAESARRQYLEPFPRDRLGAALADSVRPILQPLPRGVDLRQCRFCGHPSSLTPLLPGGGRRSGSWNRFGDLVGAQQNKA